ncbi:DUF3667 domain-containing protein [Rubrivirga sp.]|uniref:DUF3667 domain-containing protein n=1 Tax=Rubrivirga sp. TaxID=1885344 RepID=UPI003C7536A7
MTDPDALVLEDGPCVSCGTDLVGPYCHACGERRLVLEDEALWPFLREQFHEVTSADGRLWRTAGALFVPGKLTEEFSAGRRRLYLRPVRIFLILNILFFLWVGVFGGQGFVGDASLYRSNWRFADRMVEAAATAGLEDAAFDAAFSARARSLAPTLIAVFIPGLMLALTLVLAPARPSFVRHAVFATHFVAVLMATTILVSLVLALPIFAVRVVTGKVLYNLNDDILIPIFLILWSAYLVIGIRRVYDVPWWGAAASGLTVATGGTLVALEVYRTVLFFVTVWTVDAPV